MALALYNKITIEELVYPDKGLVINMMQGESENEDSLLTIPTDKTNIVYKAIELLYSYVGQTPPDLRITIQTDIPIAKGLGSSASVIVGGILAANKLLGNPADEAALLSIANEIEGHPDNTTPAMVGGFCISSLENDGSIIYKKIEWPDEWKIAVCIPDYELATQISRSVLPEAVSMEDAVYNLKKTAMFIDSVRTKDSEWMKNALSDRLHQPYRTRLIPGFEELKEDLEQVPEVLGTVISGAGPSVIVLYEDGNFDEINKRIHAIWENLGLKVSVKKLHIDTNGAVIL
jgi:homoserine kinase